MLKPGNLCLIGKGSPIFLFKDREDYVIQFSAEEIVLVLDPDSFKNERKIVSLRSFSPSISSIEMFPILRRSMIYLTHKVNLKVLQ